MIAELLSAFKYEELFESNAGSLRLYLFTKNTDAGRAVFEACTGKDAGSLFGDSKTDEEAACIGYTISLEINEKTGEVYAAISPTIDNGGDITDIDPSDMNIDDAALIELVKSCQKDITNPYAKLPDELIAKLHQ